ncbi:MAG: hypothetical protein ABIB61_03890 [Candidatus Shapirobacteria bacterium]
MSAEKNPGSQDEIIRFMSEHYRGRTPPSGSLDALIQAQEKEISTKDDPGNQQDKLLL